jgi:hypothetical protein
MTPSIEADRNRKLDLESLGPKWKSILVVGAIAALLAAIVFRRWLSAELAMLRSFGVFQIGGDPEPTTVDAWFAFL